MNLRAGWTLLGALMIITSCTIETGDGGVSPARIDSSIEGFCKTAATCGKWVSSSKCRDDSHTQFEVSYAGKSKDCQLAKLAHFDCEAMSACDDWGAGCETIEADKEDVCAE
jgi:hypothetical protein